MSSAAGLATPAVRDWPEAVEALRARGAEQRDPVRWRFIEALARRAALHDGAVRAQLDRRLEQLLAGLEETLARASSTAVDAPAPQGRGPLAGLVEHIAQQAPLREAANTGGSTVELKTLAYFRRTWSRLSAEQRVRQSLAQRPENAGPLNSQGLAHRALALMQSLSPDYLQHFVAHVDGLLWLEQAAATAEPGAGRATGERKAATRKR